MPVFRNQLKIDEKRRSDDEKQRNSDKLHQSELPGVSLKSDVHVLDHLADLYDKHQTIKQTKDGCEQKC
ncbi:hypothetical protein DPMN_140790 [Dreissena polymorpha]|uniref:Uncharacterized protein n=1 Tax=Dreissena polymorpha TaxID=45954 RepID=A0A9D4JHQ1_DREPO|nr:hypothetical protein DPMN_140790 [Dreissena polymorpha]